jgi:predicted dehydrogenase
MKIRVGILGCGKVADQHATQIRKITGAEIAAVCDSEPLMALQLQERFNASRHFTSASEMLAAGKLDVVHITTPPQNHFESGKMCLEAGCNVYIEKPFTMNAGEAEELIDLAQRRGLKLTAGHNAQFTPAMIRMRELVGKGYLGGAPVHLESIYCYNLGDESYAKALLGDKEHWVRKLPGSLLQNIISHGITKIVEFLKGDNPRVVASGFTSPFLKRIGQDDIIDEVRVIIEDDNLMTAYFTFSSQISPTVHQFRLFGPRNSLLVDDDHQVLIKSENREYKSYLRYFVPPFLFAWQYMENFNTNLRKFIKKDFHLPFDAGMKTLIESFYASINGNAPLPLPYKEIILTARIMDQIFDQISHKQRKTTGKKRPIKQASARSRLGTAR